MADAVGIVTVTVKAKDAASMGLFETAFNQFLPMIQDLPYIKDHPDKISFNFRNNGTNASADVILKDQDIIAKMKELNIDISKHHQFKASLQTDFKINEIFTSPSEELIKKALRIIFSIKGSLMNTKYLLKAFHEALNSVPVPTDEKKLKKLKKIKKFINAFLIFIGLQFSFKYDSEQLSIITKKRLEKLLDGNLDEKKAELEGLIVMGKEMVDELGFTETLKVLDADKIVISFLFPEKKNGIAFTLNNPGLSQLITEKLLAEENKA